MEPIIFALAAMLLWGVGDFLIHRSVRESGVALSLFATALVGTIALAPWAIPTLGSLTLPYWLFFIALGALLTLAAILDFKALEIGKLGIVEIIFCVEIPVTAALAVWLHGDIISWYQGIIMIALLAGMLLLFFEKFSLRSVLERGAVLAFAGAVTMGFVNFLTADASQRTTAILAIWLPGIVLLVSSGVWLIKSGVRSAVSNVKLAWKALLLMAVIDTAAWVCYAYATSAGETAITTAITQGYPAIALVLGVRFNHERFAKHQWAGAAITFIAAILLAVSM